MSARRRRATGLVAAAVAACGLVSAKAAGPSFVDITWLSISNMYYEIGSRHILTDGYITRIPQSEFFGGGGGLASTHHPFRPDVGAVTRVMNALGGPSSVDLLLTGHSHFDHAFDTPTWSRLTGAPIVGSQSTCLQAQAEGLPESRCRRVNGGETITIAEGVVLRVVRWNHSGSHERNPEQHDPVELHAVPQRDPSSGGLHAGVAEDFPNGGGNRAYLFTVDAPDGRFSWFFQNSASASDLMQPVVVDGVSYGAPLDNLRAAMKDAGLDSVDLWIASSDETVARLVVPVLKPKRLLPVHWDSFFAAFEKGVTRPFADPGLEAFLADADITLVRPAQYMDKWRLDRTGMRSRDNDSVKRALGFLP